MKVIEPTKNEIFKHMRMCGCCWIGGHGYECRYRTNIGNCFAEQNERLWSEIMDLIFPQV